MCRLLKIHGDSLFPDYQEGDFVLVSKIPFLFFAPRSGQVIAFQMPPYGTLIKRIDQVFEAGDAFFVIGSHPHSVDSRQFGLVLRQSIIGRVIWHIPRPRS